MFLSYTGKIAMIYVNDYSCEVTLASADINRKWGQKL